MKKNSLPESNEEANSHEYLLRVELPKVLHAIDKLLKPRKYGFRASATVPKNITLLVYESGKCKVKFSYFRDRPYISEPLELRVSYGRLHAPYNQDVVDWDHRKCYCWHSLEVSPFLSFLDGLSPIEAMQLKWPASLNEFFESSKGKKWTPVEFVVSRHAFIWERYNQRLFDLFDLRNPEQWEKYAIFIKEYDRIGNETGNHLVRSHDGIRWPRLCDIY